MNTTSSNHLPINIQYNIIRLIWRCSTVSFKSRLTLGLVCRQWFELVCRLVGKIRINTSIFSSPQHIINHLSSDYCVLSPKQSLISHVSIHFNDPNVIIDSRFSTILSLVITKSTCHLSFVKLHSGENTDIYSTIEMMKSLLNQNINNNHNLSSSSSSSSSLVSMSFKFYSFYLNNHLESYKSIFEMLTITNLLQEIKSYSLYIASLHFDTQSFLQLLRASESLSSLRLYFSHVHMTNPEFLSFFGALASGFGKYITSLQIRGGGVAAPIEAIPHFSKLTNIQKLKLLDLVNNNNINNINNSNNNNNNINSNGSIGGGGGGNLNMSGSTTSTFLLETDPFSTLLASSLNCIQRLELKKSVDEIQLIQIASMPNLSSLSISLPPMIKLPSTISFQLSSRTKHVQITNLGGPDTFSQFLISNPHIERLELGPFITKEEILHLSYYLLSTKSLTSLSLFSDKSTGESGLANANTSLTTTHQINQTCTDSSIKFFEFAMSTNRTLTHIHTPLRSDFYLKAVLSLINRPNIVPRIYTFEILSEKLIESLKYPFYEYQMVVVPTTHPTTAQSHSSLDCPMPLNQALTQTTPCTNFQIHNSGSAHTVLLTTPNQSFSIATPPKASPYSINRYQESL
ncbi:hypothetical protein DFA_06698 [Cavenderia fasciculata]|uniref:F-box domain-containing protein n=1 Tax=Cavenderia fasciculata TaxID=261658 RepID=F4Q211_CACFS|nr:uncharacterized protein DFA_06698 [Cavenderia fasciculata]EGG18031.1 hypothetical protein DFA_06698 [Cavenderia fasciculata]|eukprot:XP_004356924.1 hypothetical protein DFA_06698 [Cavenderia fasciculata]